MGIDETLGAKKLGFAVGASGLKNNVSPFEFKTCIVSSNSDYLFYTWDDSENSEEDGIGFVKSIKKNDGRWVLSQSISGTVSVNSVDYLPKIPAYEKSFVLVIDNGRVSIFKSKESNNYDSLTTFQSSRPGWIWERVSLIENDHVNFFRFGKVTPDLKWRINHNLSRHPSVTVISSTKEEVFGDVKHIDQNNLEIIFSEEIIGTAYLV